MDEAWVGPAHAWAIQGCDGSAFLGASVVVPVGRIDAQWEEDRSAGYSSLTLVMPPRFVAWYADGERCSLDVGLAGHAAAPCPGRPPAPPSVGWGHLLP